MIDAGPRLAVGDTLKKSPTIPILKVPCSSNHPPPSIVHWMLSGFSSFICLNLSSSPPSVSPRSSIPRLAVSSLDSPRPSSSTSS